MYAQQSIDLFAEAKRVPVVNDFSGLLRKPESLRPFLLTQPDSQACVVESGAPAQGLVPAAVLVPVVNRPTGVHLLLTKRTDHLRDHPGQISFPGGRVEPEDVSPDATALREAFEEIGLPPSASQVLGYLPEYRTGTGFSVIPVVAAVAQPFDLNLDAFEVAEAFEVPLSFLLDPANHQRHRMFVRGAEREYHAMQYGPYCIWGATAGMIMSLARQCGIVTD